MHERQNDKQQEKKPGDIQTLRWIFARAKGQRLRILYLILANAGEALLSVWFALVCRGLVDHATAGERAGLIRYACLLFAVIAVRLLIHLVTDAVWEYVLAKLRLQFQGGLLKTLLHKEYADTVRYHSGELLNRIFSDADVVTGGMVSVLPSLAWLSFRLVGAAAVLLALAPSFTLLLLIAGVLLCLVLLLLRGKLKFLHKRVQEAEGQMRSFLQETMESMLIIKVFGAGEAVWGKNREYQDRYFSARLKRRTVSVISSAGFGAIFQAGYFLTMVWGCFGIYSGTMSYGTLTAMLQLVNQIQSPFSGFSSLVSRVYSVLASAERLMELERLPDEKQAVGAAPYPRLTELRFDHVGFTYGRTPVLTDVSFRIEKGDFVSLTGISGGGKSTIFLLMLGAYRPAAGAIQFRFAGEPHALAPDNATRGLFAYVPQGNLLLSGTLRENLEIFRSGVEEQALWQALRVACAEDFVRELPQGLDTMLGERGAGLSEGQRQRLAVARAVLSGAPVLLLDEATSALDEETEARLLENIRALRNRTCLIVTHRKAALAICNRHLLLENGRITDMEQSQEAPPRV